MKKKRKVLTCLAAGFLTAAVGAAWYLENNDLGTTQLFYQDDKLPVAFDGFRIVQVADLHDKRFGPRQERLLSALRAAKPDCIVMTGDLIDRAAQGWSAAAAFIQGAVEIAPVYFVTGNHENWSGQAEDVKRFLAKANVVVLDDRCETLTRGNESILLAGVSDETCQRRKAGEMGRRFCSQRSAGCWKVRRLSDPSGASSRALCYICAGGLDLVFCGHAHGGQFRLPGVGGLYALARVFPKVHGRAVYHGGDDDDC